MGGVNAPALAGALWAVEGGAEIVRRRRFAGSARARRLADALAGGPVSFPAGHGPYVWLSSSESDGADWPSSWRAAHLRRPGAAWGDDDHVRATLRDGEATDRLAAALR